MFDINLLPMNLQNGRNRGILPGMFVFTAPKRCDKNRRNDVLILLLSSPEENDSLKYEEWSELLAAEYFAADGSFTMGFTSAVKKLSKTIGKESKKADIPDICLHMAVIRDRTMLIAHGGPLHTTAVFSDHVENFSDDTALPINREDCDLRFFRTEIHNEDLILLCPRVPDGWNNESILAAIGESPLNAVRFLLNLSDGNLQAAVIQIRTGRGEIMVRSKMPIITEIRPERPQEMTEFPLTPQPQKTDSSRPLYRSRRSGGLPEEFVLKEKAKPEREKDTEEEENAPKSALKNDTSETIPAEITSLTEAESGPDVIPEQASSDPEVTPEQRKRTKSSGRQKPKRKHNRKVFILALICGLLVPILVAGGLFFAYTGRSNSKLHRQYLEEAVTEAQSAIDAPLPSLTESRWLKTLEDLNNALTYGSSPAARELKSLTLSELDELMGSVHVQYRFGTSSVLPAGIRLTRFAAADQFTYALDSGSGGVIRFAAGSSGMVRDTNFVCNPGTYPTKDGKETVKVGAFRDFVLLPSGNSSNDLLAAMDGDGNIAYCSVYSGNTAASPERPTPAFTDVDGLYLFDNQLFVLDAHNSALWVYGYNKDEGVYGTPSAYYGSYTPNLTEVKDFVVYKEYAYFLRENSSLMMCDFTGYLPVCSNYSELSSADGSVVIDLTKHDIGEIMMNRSPDNSLYLTDRQLQTVINTSVKLNIVRTIAPDRDNSEQPVGNAPAAFGITGQDRLIWAFNNYIYIGNMP